MKDIEKLCQEKGKAEGLIEMVTYGQLNGEAALKQAADLLGQ